MSTTMAARIKSLGVLDTPTLMNVNLESPNAFMKEVNSAFGFCEDDITTHIINKKTSASPTTTVTTATPVLRQMSVNTMLKQVVSHAFIPESAEPEFDMSPISSIPAPTATNSAGDCGEMLLLGDVSAPRMTADQGGGQRPGVDSGGGIAAELSVADTLTAVATTTPLSTKTKLNKREIKALAKKDSMDAAKYAKYAAYRNKNNASVARSRRKKRQKLADSEALCNALEQDKQLLVERVTELEAEVKSLMAMLIKNTVSTTGTS